MDTPDPRTQEPEELFVHQDGLQALGGEGVLMGRLEAIHAQLMAIDATIQRVAVALYEEERGLVRTFVWSDQEKTDLRAYEVPLDRCPSLAETRRRGRPRVVHDLSIFAEGAGEHILRIRTKGYRSSYTLPIYQGTRFFGFVFINSTRPGTFKGALLPTVDLFAHLIAAQVVQELSAARTLAASVKTLIEAVRCRDPETGNHLHRIARFTQLIGRHLALAGGEPLTDEHIERLFLLAPLHDVGKIAIPDHILLKPARLDEAEWEVMKTHAERGREIIESIIRNFEFSRPPDLEALRNVTGLHHEALDGSGYPWGLAGEQIPLDARIVTVADIFDALTSLRPYKRRWTNAEAFAFLRGEAAPKVDPRCVEALVLHPAEVESIQRQFTDEPGSPAP